LPFLAQFRSVNYVLLVLRVILAGIV
jgi:hypothetical protein